MSQEFAESSSQTGKSLKNTTTGLEIHDLRVLRSARPEDAEDKAVAALQSQMETLRTERKQERFFWMMAASALLYVIVGMAAPWYVSTPFLLFGLLFLIAAAKWLEVPFIVTHLERWFDRASVTRRPGETE